MRIQRQCLVACLVATAFSDADRAAHAGALLEPTNSGIAITTASFSSSTRAFDVYGRLVHIPAYEKFELASYIEYGISDRLTFIARPSFSAVPVGAAAQRAAVSTDLGLRLGLFASAHDAISLQDTLHLPTDMRARQRYILDAENIISNELSLLATHSFMIDSIGLFADVAGGYRWQSQGFPDEWHGDVTIGIRPQEKLLWLIQGFATLSAGAGSFGSYAALKFQISAVYDFDKNYSLQLGGFETLAGRNNGRELGPMAGLWYRF